MRERDQAKFLLGIKRMFQTNATLSRVRANVLVVRSIFSFFRGAVNGTPSGVLPSSVSISLLSLRHPPLLLALAACLIFWRSWTSQLLLPWLQPAAVVMLARSFLLLVFIVKEQNCMNAYICFVCTRWHASCLSWMHARQCQ